MAVNLDACIQCNLCVRACREVQVNDVIGMAGRGHHREDRVRLRRSDGRLDLRRLRRMRAGLPDRRADAGDAWSTRTTSITGKPDRTVDSVCPYCGVGCQLTYQIKDDKLVSVSGKNGPANQNRLCVKGRFGFDYVANPQRLLKPMIRKDGVPKVPHEFIDPSNPWTHFREATWEEALDRAAVGPEENPRPRRRRRRSPASARPRARTKRPICSRSWCAPASAPTTSTTARGSATPRRWRRCWKASARPR